MDFIPSALIKKKRMGEALTNHEIDLIVQAYASGDLPDYQMSALLMAIYFKGMNDTEIFRLTQGMIQSGKVFDLTGIPGTKIDKHSTGGVGDKTSLILAPIVASCGVTVPMMSGRGLGHTGGTLDKLDSIPGFRTQLSEEEFKSLLQTHGVSFIGQTNEVCPADKKLYALRDVTATVESLPLICSSIMSKKIAEGIDGLVLDVKFGSGAFMKSVEESKMLAHKLIEIGERFGKRTIAFVTRMDQPLGRWVGNAVEVKECLEILKNDSSALSKYSDCRLLSLQLSAAMIWLGGQADSLSEGLQRATKALESGAAYEKFRAICQSQGGDLSSLPALKNEKHILSPRDGYVASFQAETLGMAALTLGAGRKTKDDVLDLSAGIYFHSKVGERTFKGQPLFSIYGENKNQFEAAEKLLIQATMLNSDLPPLRPLVHEIISHQGLLTI